MHQSPLSFITCHSVIFLTHNNCYRSAIYLSIIYLFLQICYTCSGATSLPNNMILDCEECGKTVHQKCARPEITASQAKDPRFLFVCSDCKDREVWIYHLYYHTVIRPKFGYVGTSIYFVSSFLLTASIFYVLSWSKNAYVTSSLALPRILYPCLQWK